MTRKYNKTKYIPKIGDRFTAYPKGYRHQVRGYPFICVEGDNQKVNVYAVQENGHDENGDKIKREFIRARFVFVKLGRDNGVVASQRSVVGRAKNPPDNINT